MILIWRVVGVCVERDDSSYKINFRTFGCRDEFDEDHGYFCFDERDGGLEGTTRQRRRSRVMC